MMNSYFQNNFKIVRPTMINWKNAIKSLSRRSFPAEFFIIEVRPPGLSENHAKKKIGSVLYLTLNIF